MDLRRFARVGDVEKRERLPKSRDNGRCCQDNVPVRLRAKGDGGVGLVGEVSISYSFAFGSSGTSVSVESCRLVESGLLEASRSAVCVVGSKCSGGSIGREPMEEMLNRAASKTGESFVGDNDRARSVNVTDKISF